MAAARKSSRYGHRDATMILIGYRHGLRASELCDLQWSQIELATGRLHVRRAKKVAILKEGVGAWNAWRAENPDIRPDLGRADLSGTNLTEADFPIPDGCGVVFCMHRL
jgi:integrase